MSLTVMPYCDRSNGAGCGDWLARAFLAGGASMAGMADSPLRLRNGHRPIQSRLPRPSRNSGPVVTLTQIERTLRPETNAVSPIRPSGRLLDASNELIRMRNRCLD